MKRISVEAECKGATMEELIPEIVWELKRRDKKSRPVYKKLIKQAEALEDFEGDEAQQVYDALIQAMDDIAPPYFFFSPVEGGYNYTLDSTGLEEVLKVGDHKDLPKKYRGEYIYVNDHGNMTLYYRNSRGQDREIWGIV